MEIETRVAGIPCIARVTHYFRQAPHRGGAHTCDSDLDYYGYTECEFDILDRRGRPPPGWSARQPTRTASASSRKSPSNWRTDHEHQESKNQPDPTRKARGV